MSPRSAMMRLLMKAGIGFAALFVVGVVLAAIPNHRPPVTTQASETSAIEPTQEQGQAMDHSKMPGMDLDDAKSSEQDAMHDMSHMHHGDTQHMHMTAPRPQGPAPTKSLATEDGLRKSVVGSF